MKFSHFISGVLIFFGVTIAQAIPLECGNISLIQGHFLANHISYKGMRGIGPESLKQIENRIREQYLKTLDRSKLYLLDSDVKAIEQKLQNSIVQVQNRKCDFLEEIEGVLGKRVKERYDFAKTYLTDKNFKFDKKTELMLDPDKRKYSKTKEELNAFHKKYLQFQIATYLQTGLKLDEAKTNTLKRYERANRRYDDSPAPAKPKEGDAEEFEITKMSKADKLGELYDQYLNAFARSLDPHSNYLSQDMLEDFEISMRLSLEGIGATLSSQDGFTVIEQLIPGGAAALSGKLQPKDKIIAVGQGTDGKLVNVVEMDLRDVVKKIRGAKGSSVRLVVLRKTGSEQKRFEVSLIRDKINLEDEAASITYLDKEEGGVKKKIGLVNLPSFYSGPVSDGPFGEVRSSAGDLKKILAEARAKNVDAIVLDLSTNGGGSLEDAVNIAGLFFKTGGVVKETGPDGDKIRGDMDSTVDWAGPLVVLTSRISASASEIVAGTLKDYKRGIILGGDHTFGKGTIQQVSKLPKKQGATKITVGMFFVPGGSTTQHGGVNADIVLPSVFSTDEIGEKTLDYSLLPRKTEPFVSPEAYVSDGSGKWTPVNDDVVKELKKRSSDRVAESADFKKVFEDIKKAKDLEKNKITKLSELMKEKPEGDDKKEEKKKSKFGSKEEKTAEYLKRADIKEAANVAFDLAQKLSGQPLILVDHSSNETAKK